MIRLSFHFSVRLFGKDRCTPLRDYTSDEHFATLATEAIHMLSQARAKSTVDNYRTALRSFLCYAGSDLLFGDVNTQLVEGYQQWLLGQCISLNSVSCYMRSLRALIRLVKPETNVQQLFGRVFTGKTRTEKRSISVEEATLIKRCRLPEGSVLAFSRDIFMFSFYALGMPFVDIAFLRKTQVAGGYITYNRHKTGQRIRVRVEPPMQQILDRYSQKDSPYVFPILTMDDNRNVAAQYESARSRYNRHLKQLGLQTGLQHILTSYVARHSWASIAYHSNVDLSVISKALGHTSPNTTLTYIREIDDNRIDTANSELLRQLLLH